jgi:antitoxin MazE
MPSITAWCDNFIILPYLQGMTAKTFISGDATAVLLPKELVVQYHLEDEVAIIPTEDGVLIKSIQVTAVAPREQWAELFARAVQEGRMPALEETDFTENEFDKKDWTWPGI